MIICSLGFPQSVPGEIAIRRASAMLAIIPSFKTIASFHFLPTLLDGHRITGHMSQYQKEKLAAEKVLRLSTRCYLCCEAAGRLAWLKILEREKDGVPLCIASRKCENPRALG